MIVVDASVVLELLLQTRRAPLIAERVFATKRAFTPRTC